MSGALQHSPAYIIHTLCMDLGLGNLPGQGDWPSFINNSDAINTQRIIVSDTTGRLSGKAQVTRMTVEHYGIQIQVRAEQQPSFRKSNEIFVALDGVNRVVVTLDQSEYRINAVTPTTTIIRMGKEQPEDYLYIHSLNFVTSITPLT